VAAALLGHAEMLGRARLYREDRESAVSRETILDLLGREASYVSEISLRVRIGGSEGTLRFRVLDSHRLEIGRQDWPILGVEERLGRLWDREGDTLPLWTHNQDLGILKY